MEAKRGMDIPRFFAVLQVFNIFWESFLGGGKRKGWKSDDCGFDYRD